MLIRIFGGWLAFLAMLPAAAQDADYLGGIPPGDGPLEVRIGFNLVNITDVGEKEETLDFDGAIYLSWTDPRLAYEPEEYGMSADWRPGDYSRAPARIYQGVFAVREVFEGWRPHVFVPNGIGDREASNLAVAIWPDGRLMYTETFYTKVETPMDLRRFPFDRQRLEIFFQPIVYQRDELVLIPDDSLARTWDRNMGIADWVRGDVTMEEQPTEIVYFDGSRSEISEFVVTVEIKRRPMHFLLSIVFPMVLLVSLTWCVFWMDGETLANRVNITFIGILSVVAYYFVMLGSVPEVSYLTLMDAFVLATFLILSASVVLIVVVERIGGDQNRKIVARVDRICRWAFPLGYLIWAMLLGFMFLIL
jgi:hypothetical protein